MAEKAFDTSELAEALPAERDPDFFPLNDLPNDVLVSVFAVAAAEDPTWVRHTFPLVCKDWAALYDSKDASPLHERVHVDFQNEVKVAWQDWLRLVARPEVAGAATQQLVPFRPVVHASRLISWAERRAGSVHNLSLDVGSRGGFKDFTAEDLGALVAVAGPSLNGLYTGSGFGELLQKGKPFWKSLRDHVVPAGRLRSFFVLEGNPSDSDVEPLGQLAGSLEKLELAAPYGWHPATLGLPRFPESFCALTKLKRLDLIRHPRIPAIPAKISSLKKLKVLQLCACRLSSLPKELGELSGLDFLNVSGNKHLGTAPEAVAFPAELGNMTSLRQLDLSSCGLRAVPAFVGELKSLEELGLRWNGGVEIFASLDFVIEGCPRLRKVLLHEGTYLPEWTPRWTPEWLLCVEAFKAKLRAKNSSAEVLY